MPSGHQAWDWFQQEHARAKRRQLAQAAIIGVLFVIAVLVSAHISRLSPGRLWEAFPRMGDYIERTLPEIRAGSLLSDLSLWYYAFPRWLGLLLDTLVIALIATCAGSIAAGLLCWTASRNLVCSTWAYHLTRRIAEAARTVPEVVFALVFVIAFGIGATAGLLAISIHSFGALTKLFSEVNENIDDKPLEGLRASGANWSQTIRFAVLPQVAPGFTSYILWRLELNVRSAAIIGFVGAGGIGQELYHAISLGYYEDISAIVLMIIVTVTMIDLICERLRHRLIGREYLT